MKNKIIGYGLLVVMFAGLYVFLGIFMGFYPTSIAFGLTALMVSLLGLSMYFLNKG